MTAIEKNNKGIKKSVKDCLYAYLTQKVEAKVILDIIGKHLENKGIPYITLHDAFFIPENFVDICPLIKS